MKQYIILSAMLLLLTAAVVAVEGDVEVSSFKVYENGVRLQGDFDDDDFIIRPGTTIEVQSRLENPYNASVSVNVEGTLFDIGDDISREHTIDIDSDERGEALVFEYFIPADTRLGNYDFLFEYSYSFQGDSFKHDKDFNFRVVQEETDTNDILLNLTQFIADEKRENNELLSTLINLSSVVLQLSECTGQVGMLNASLKSKEAFETRYWACDDKVERVQRESLSCNGQKAAMFTLAQVQNQTAVAANIARVQQKKSSDNQLFMLAGAVIAWWYVSKKKKNVGGEGEGKPLTGQW